MRKIGIFEELLIGLIIGISIPGAYIGYSYFFDVWLKTCFTPGEQCEAQIVDRISHSEKSIDVMAYRLTSEKITDALIYAKNRDVKVRIILDKTATSEAYDLVLNSMDVWVDRHPKIAHNKVIIFDGKEVETGSFNYTESAQNHNAENVLFVRNSEVVKKYQDNFNKRLSESEQIKMQE